jgi:thiol-disulfide isomerase/thioredoxin
MFKRSFLMVALIFTLVFASAFASQMMMTRDLPSAYDSGLTIEKAFKTSQVPLLVEFYSDTCGTCKRLAPIIHDLLETRYQNRLTAVMMDVDDPANAQIAQLFGVDALPGLFVFDHKHMKKHQIKAEEFVSEERLQLAIDQALTRTGSRSATKAALNP